MGPGNRVLAIAGPRAGLEGTVIRRCSGWNSAYEYVWFDGDDMFMDYWPTHLKVIGQLSETERRAFPCCENISQVPKSVCHRLD